MCSTRVAMSLMIETNEPVRRAERAVAHQDPEAVGGCLDVVEQRERRLLEQHRAATPRSARRASCRAAAAPRGRRRRRTGPPCRRSARRRPAWTPRRARRSPRRRRRRSRARRTAPRAIAISCSRRSAAGHPAARGRACVTRSSAQRWVGRHAGAQATRPVRDAAWPRAAPRPASGRRCTQPSLLEQPDHPGRRVDLAAQHAVPRAGRVGVVQVVPRLAHRRDREPPDVARTCRGRRTAGRRACGRSS